MGLWTQATPEHDTGDGTAGTSGKAQVDHPTATTVTAFYDVSASTDAINIEGSTDGSGWRTLDETVASGDVTTGGDTVNITTAYQFVRVYAGSSFSDGDVDTIELTAKGL